MTDRTDLPASLFPFPFPLAWVPCIHTIWPVRGRRSMRRGHVMNVVSDAEALQVLLDELRREHRALDQQITDRQVGVISDPLTLKRLKKRKLQLKDQISRIEDQLYPDIIA